MGQVSDLMEKMIPKDKAVLSAIISATDGPEQAGDLMTEACVMSIEKEMGKSMPEDVRDSVRKVIRRTVHSAIAMMLLAADLAGKESGCGFKPGLDLPK